VDVESNYCLASTFYYMEKKKEREARLKCGGE
jgi:hypothetical protein